MTSPSILTGQGGEGQGAAAGASEPALALTGQAPSGLDAARFDQAQVTQADREAAAPLMRSNVVTWQDEYVRRLLAGEYDDHATIQAFARHRQSACNSHDDLVAALDGVMVGGNHLATVLIDYLGAGFAERFPPETDPEDALRVLCATNAYDVWCCWRTIMLARRALSLALGESK